VKLLVELLVWMFNPFRVVIDLLKWKPIPRYNLV
jgi:hypothetical protein